MYNVSILSSCRPLDQGNLLRLYNGVGRIVCEFRGAKATPAYLTPLVAELEYGYRSTISTGFELVSSE